MLPTACITACLLLAAAASPTAQRPVDTQCGYQSCGKTVDGMLNVHLIPHSHDDVGWLKTVDEYYYGSRSNIQKAGVQYILDSVIQELVHGPAKKFIYVETAYLWKWWMHQHDTIKHRVRKLVNSGQLEIVSGGWTMNDEAVTHYQSTVDQMTWGLRKLNDTFGACGRPRAGWQIDPFGHSREQASLFARMGFDGLFIGRLDVQDKRQRLSTRSAEMVWRGSPDSQGSKSDLFTHALFNGYSPPPGFCFDILCNDEPMIEDKKSSAYNVPGKVGDFLAFVAAQHRSYASDHVLLTMGGDFTYQDAGMAFANLDRLIRHVNAAQANGSKVNALYSTPSCYLAAAQRANLTWPTKTDDFFPYSSDPHAFWTGYFTSKPNLKRFERYANNFLQVCKQLYALAELGPEDAADLNALREATAVMQHHDAITGTAKEHVVQDYARRLAHGFDEAGIVADVAINKLSKIGDVESPVSYGSCLLLNASSCDASESAGRLVVTLFNPLGHVVTHHVRLPVSGGSYSVRAPDGSAVATQLVPIPDAVLAMPGRSSRAVRELVFVAAALPPLGYRQYFVERGNRINTWDSDSVEDAGQAGFIGGERVRVSLDADGNVEGVEMGGVTLPLDQSFGFYRAAAGDNKEFERRASGAYIFRPNGTHPEPLPIKSFKVYKGALVDEVHQTFGDGWVSQVVRIYHDDDHAEFEWMVGPIPSRDGVGKEVITRYSSNLKTAAAFFTDSNGREMLKRVRNFRPTWKLTLEEPVAGNYYPVVSRIALTDVDAGIALAVLPDRAQGGTSLNDGEIELMLHRRLFYDDGFGVDEPLDEQRFGRGLVARGNHYVLAGGVAGGVVARQRALALRKQLPPWTFLTTLAEDVTFEKWTAVHRMEFSGLRMPLPSNVHLLTLEPWKGSSLLVRLEHFLEAGEDAELSKPATVDLQNLFSPFAITSARETTLGGNQWLAESERLRWRSETNEVLPPDEAVRTAPLDLKNVRLTPMEIRTFVVEISLK